MKLSVVAMCALVLIVASASAQSFTTDKSEFYPYGNAAMAKPNVLKLDGARVTLNGIQVFPLVVANPQHPVEVTASPCDSIYESAWALQRELEHKSVPIDQIAEEMAKHFKRSGQVDSVSSIRDNSFWVWWKCPAHRELISVIPSTPRPTAELLARQTYDLLKSVLERDCLVVVTSKGNYYAPSNDQSRLQAIRQEMRLARAKANLDEPEFGRQWANKELPAFVAYQFAHPLTTAAMKGGQ
jgi:hypothetical protein